MELECTQIKKMAQLAKIALSEQDTLTLKNELSEILEIVALVNEQPTESIEPLTHPQDQILSLRADIVTEIDQSPALLHLAKKSTAGQYVVPKVID
jgi:aspartyl-tRNA(Asn)/glutamyl-tRNA(Gln) amidotransferase subunit C